MPKNKKDSFLENSEIIIYQTADGLTKLDVRMGSETLWLTQAQMVELFQTTKQNISLHISNIFSEGELEQNSVVKEYLTTAADGKNYRTKYYNLSIILAVGYRVKSDRGTQFRQWATAVLHEYLQKGFAINDEKLKEFGGGDYWNYKRNLNAEERREEYRHRITRINTNYFLFLIYSRFTGIIYLTSKLFNGKKI